MYFIGIDPGSSGAIAIIDKNDKPVAVHDMPMRYLMPRKKAKITKTGKKLKTPKQDSRKVLDAKVIAKILGPYVKNITWCVLESVNSRSAQGVKSVFSFGERFGALKGVLESLGVNYHMTAPVVWQKHFDLTGKKEDLGEHKINIMKKCRGFYPDIEYHGPKGGLKDGRSDALLLARYGKINQKHGQWTGESPFGERS